MIAINSNWDKKLIIIAINNIIVIKNMIVIKNIIVINNITDSE
jgi:hypothetical protein